MFAVIRAGGKQFRVVKDDRITVERMAGEPGTMIEFSDVLMLGGDGQAPRVGRPAVDKAAVFAEVLEHNRAEKILVFKKKRRNNYRRKGGHRQGQTLLRIVGVSPTGEKPEFAPTPKKEPRPETKKKAKAKAPAKEADEDTRPAKKAEEKAVPKKKADKAARDEAPKKKAPAKKKPAKVKSKE
ncbi:MAG: 50S ribosomal protein L21 [Rhodospirillales bacterium RIFCSPLOWO2_01_FULL_65_14]|nr:MAG: 50S ribosomal protein L21 [Rhodospirillales bacterium RIFCSPLOWO2_01_FULL_65_14]